MNNYDWSGPLTAITAFTAAMPGLHILLLTVLGWADYWADRYLILRLTFGLWATMMLVVGLLLLVDTRVFGLLT